MFILIPLVIIFLCISYLQLNDNIGIYTQSFIYILILLTIVLSLYLYKKVKEDMKQQESNTIQLEINQLINKLATINDEKIKDAMTSKITHLQDELESLNSI